MKFIYITKTLDAPKITTILGYEFELNGNAVEVTDQKAIKKFQAMEHIGIIDLDKIDKIKIEPDKPKEKKSVFKDCFKELTKNATRNHIVNVVNSKTADYMIEYAKYFKLDIPKEDIKKAKKPELTKATLSGYLIKSLQERLNEFNKGADQGQGS